MNGKEGLRVEQATETKIQPRDDWRKKLEDFILSGEKWSEFHNNFSLILPYGSLWYDMHRERYKDKVFKIDPEKYKYNSERFKALPSLMSFFDDIDATAVEVGLDLKIIKKYNDQFDDENLYQYTLPLYIRLREKGYNYIDLEG